MFESNQKSTGTRYTTTVALLIMALILCPAAVLVAPRPIGFLTLSLAIASGVLCMILAWFNWKKSARLSIPSIVIQDLKSK